MVNHCTCSTRFHLVLSAPYPDSLGGEEPVAAVTVAQKGVAGRAKQRRPTGGRPLVAAAVEGNGVCMLV